jgi:hypothetical protein
MFGLKRREIERLRNQVANLAESNNDLSARLAAAHASTVRTAELYVIADTDAMVAVAEADGLSRALLMEHERAEWLTDQLVHALGYPEAATGAPAPQPDGTPVRASAQISDQRGPLTGPEVTP